MPEKRFAEMTIDELLEEHVKAAQRERDLVDQIGVEIEKRGLILNSMGRVASPAGQGVKYSSPCYAIPSLATLVSREDLPIAMALKILDAEKKAFRPGPARYSTSVTEEMPSTIRAVPKRKRQISLGYALPGAAKRVYARASTIAAALISGVYAANTYMQNGGKI